MYGLGSWLFTYGCVPSCATQPSLHPFYPTLPACNVTIHNRCKDTLANCTKVKQKVRGQGGLRVGVEGRDHSICLFFCSFPPLCPYPCPDLPLRPQPTVNIALPNYSVRAPKRAGQPLGPGLSWVCVGLWVTAILGVSLLLCAPATESCSAEEQHCLAVCFSPK